MYHIHGALSFEDGRLSIMQIILSCGICCSVGWYCEKRVNSYLQSRTLEHEEKQENECLAQAGNNDLLYKNLLRSS